MLVVRFSVSHRARNMAAFETQVPVLLIGIVLLAPLTALVSAESSREKIQIGLLHLNPDNAGTNDEQSLQARGLFDSFGSLFNTAVWGTLTGPINAKREVPEEEDGSEEEHKHDDHDDDHDYDEDVAEVTKGIGTANGFNNFGTGRSARFHGGHIVGSNINNGLNNLIFGNNYIQIDSDGVIMHVIDSGNHGLNMINNKIYIGNKKICSIESKSFAKPKYQNTPEGARWYTNVKVGTPMTPAEIAQFKKDWAAILKEQEETKKRLKKEAEERERQHKERMDALQARLAREAQERDRKHKEWERQHKEQMDVLQARLAREKEERERQQKERMDALQVRLKREAEARARQQEERAKERERQQKERERERERQQQERMSWRQQREARRTPSWNGWDSWW